MISRQRAGAKLLRVVCCGVSKRAWSLTVIQEIAGSNPALTARMNKAVLFYAMVSVDSIDRAPGCDSGSWGFESPPTPHMDQAAWPMLTAQNRRVSQLGDGVAWDHVAGGSSPSSPTMDLTGVGENKRTQDAPKVIAAKQAPNQQDGVRFPTGAPNDQLEGRRPQR